jgi:hypothetical protein
MEYKEEISDSFLFIILGVLQWKNPWLNIKFFKNMAVPSYCGQSA